MQPSARRIHVRPAGEEPADDPRPLLQTGGTPGTAVASWAPRDLGRHAGTRAGACHARLSAWDREPPALGPAPWDPPPRSPWPAPLPPPAPPVPGAALCAGCLGTLKRSDSLPPCTTVGPLRCTVADLAITRQARCRASRVPPTVFAVHAEVSRPRRVRLPPRPPATMGPPACAERAGTREKRRLRGSILCLYLPCQRFAEAVSPACARRGPGVRQFHGPSRPQGLAPFTHCARLVPALTRTTALDSAAWAPGGRALPEDRRRWLHSEPWSRTPSLDQVLQGPEGRPRRFGGTQRDSGT